MSDIQTLTRAALVGASTLIDATQEELEALQGHVENAIEIIDRAPTDHPMPAQAVPALSDLRFRTPVGFEVKTRGGTLSTFVTYQLPDARSHRDATLDVTVYELIEDLGWMHEHALRTAESLTAAPKLCRAPRDMHILLLEFETMTESGRFESWGHDSIFGFFVPTRSPLPTGHSFVGIHSQPAHSRRKTLVHELGHYWWSQLCLGALGITSEEFALLVEDRMD